MRRTVEEMTVEMKEEERNGRMRLLARCVDQFGLASVALSGSTPSLKLGLPLLDEFRV